MKKIFAFMSVLAICLTVFSSCSTRKAQNDGYTVYRSSPVGVQIEYPSFWEMVEDKKNQTVAFATPSEGFADTYRDNVSLCSYTIDTENEMAFDNFITEFIDNLPSTVAGYNLVSEGAYPVALYPDSYRVVYEGETDEGLLRLQQTFIKNGGRVYVYSFIAEPKSYDYFNANSEVMLTTFKALLK